MADFQSFMGPGDKNLPMSELQGYQPVSRIGEIVMNAFGTLLPLLTHSDACSPHLFSPPVSAVDAYEFGTLKNKEGEDKPQFHEWATVQPGMICVARKKKTAVFRQYIAAETAVPVIACAACQADDDDINYFFAGVARSKSVRSPDDNIGPNVDEFFTVSIGGMATLLNTSGGNIFPGDQIEWCFKPDNNKHQSKNGPRRIAIQVASVSSSKVIGRCLSFAKNGETFDLLIKQ